MRSGALLSISLCPHRVSVAPRSSSTPGCFSAGGAPGLAAPRGVPVHHHGAHGVSCERRRNGQDDRHGTSAPRYPGRSLSVAVGLRRWCRGSHWAEGRRP
eukprot:tig00001164_g7411.t1